MRSWLVATAACALLAGSAAANEIPPEQLASLGWAMSANAGSVSSGGGSPATTLAVFQGCTAPPSAPDSYPSSKDWYFDVKNGHPPAYYANLAVPQAQWGDVNHPFDNLNAIWGQNSIGGVQTDWPGWGSSTYPVATNSLHVLALYGAYRETNGHTTVDGWNPTTGVPDFGNPTTYDPSHFRLWPGDTVWARGDSAGDSFGSVNFNSGSGTVAMIPNYNEDGSGNTKWVWIKADPNFPAPLITQAGSGALTIPEARGLIVQGFNVLQQSDYSALTQAGLGNLPSSGSPQGSGGPTGHANNAVIEVPTTGGTGSGATFDITFNTSGQVQGLTLRNPGTGYSNGDTLTPVANSGLPTANAPSGIGSLTGFTITVTAPNTLLAGQGLPFVTNNMPSPPTTGETISVNTDDNGTIKTFTYGGGANPIPYPGTASIIDAELSASYVLNNDPAVSAVMTNAVGASSFPATWKTLTSITTVPSASNTFTFQYDSSTWTWVASGATGNQINAPLLAGSGGTTGTYTNVALTGGHGSGAKATIVIVGGVVTSTTITTAGTGYVVGDVLTASPGSVSGYQTTVEAVSSGGVTTVAALSDDIKAANTAMTAVYSGLTFTSVTTGSTGLSWTSSVTADKNVWSPAIPATAAPDLPAVNSTFTYFGVSTNDVWTFKASGATGHQVNIGASVQDTFNNIQTALQAAYSGTTITLPTQGANLQFTAVTPGLAGVLMLTTTIPMTNANVSAAPAPFLFLRNDTNTNVGLSISGGAVGITAVNTATSPPSVVSTALNSPAPSTAATGSTDFTSGATFTVNGVTYTWGSTGTNPVALGGTADLSLANLAAVIGGTGPGGTGNSGYQSTLVNIQAGELADTSDVIVDSLNETGWAGGVGHTFNPNASDYPSSGSFGIDPATGKHGGWTHSYWNILDWLQRPAFGAINIAGNRNHSDAGVQPVIGVSCVALTNSYIHQIPTVAFDDVYNSLAQNVNINYNSDGDSYDYYTSHDVELNNVTAYNPINPLKGIHPDGVQFGAASGFSVLTMAPFLFSNIEIFNIKFLGGTDSILNDSTGHPELFTTGFDGVSYPLIDQQTCLNDTGMRVTGAQIKGNVCYTDNILVYLNYFQHSVVANNTALNHGSSPALGNGGITIGTGLHTDGITQGHNVVVNNLAVGVGYSDTGADACADTSNTFANNLVIPAYVNGALNNPVAGGDMCARAVPPDGGTLGTGYAATSLPSHNPMEDGQIVYQPSSAVISTLIQAFTPPNNEIASPATINAEPPGYPSAPTGGLINAGTATGGYAPTTNTDGKPWPGSGVPNIGAY